MALKDKMDESQGKLAQFMEGRYGNDNFGTALLVLAVIFFLLSFPCGTWALVVTWILLIFEIFRFVSRNYEARRRENEIYLNTVGVPVSWVKHQIVKFSNRKTKAYVHCPSCNAEFSLPKGAGKVRATCPKCGEKSVHTV